MKYASTPLTRRDFLKQSLIFSSGLAAVGLFTQRSIAAETTFSKTGIHLLAFGDFGSRGNEAQLAVAKGMAAFAEKLGTPLTAIIGLGDNFYGRFTPDRFQRHFEEIYSKEKLNCPFYHCIGNHDYETFAVTPRKDDTGSPLKYEAQLKYAKDHPESRWKMPAKWYTVELGPVDRPLVKLVVWDSNRNPGTLTPQEKLEQKRFIETELTGPHNAPWLWMASHHPLSYQAKGSNAWVNDLLRTHPVSFYLTGHVHNLQHHEVEGYQPSFIVSGAGGKNLYPVRSRKHEFARSTFGFNHFHVTPEWVDTQFIDSEGRRLHAFRRTSGGEVIIHSPNGGS